MDERSAWIALASIDGVGDETWAKLFADFGTAAAALEAGSNGRLDAWMTDRRARDGQVPLTRHGLAAFRATATDPRRPLEELARRGLWTLTPLDADYPARLRDLDPQPVTIHGLGNADCLRHDRCVAVVGTRTPTPAGRALTAKVATRLVECGAVVVSGLAIGIDGAAHAAALAAGGLTTGVIGGGHDFPGPKAHARLRADVAARGGAVISEYFPTASARHGTFPRRNRIIAALGDATIVIEAPITSGARITADRAVELDRPVLVAPGRIGDWATAGSLALLRESLARPLVGLDEMVEDLGLLQPPKMQPHSDAPTGTHEQLLAALGAAEQAVARRLLRGPASLDAIVMETELSPAVASGAVTLLLLRGWAQSVGPAYIVAGALAR